jgi:hypothetical protein
LHFYLFVLILTCYVANISILAHIHDFFIFFLIYVLWYTLCDKLLYFCFKLCLSYFLLSLKNNNYLTPPLHASKLKQYEWKNEYATMPWNDVCYTKEHSRCIKMHRLKKKKKKRKKEKKKASHCYHIKTHLNISFWITWKGKKLCICCVLSLLGSFCLSHKEA